jgi:hypothetical protein
VIFRGVPRASQMTMRNPHCVLTGGDALQHGRRLAAWTQTETVMLLLAAAAACHAAAHHHGARAEQRQVRDGAASGCVVLASGNQ